MFPVNFVFILPFKITFIALICMPKLSFFFFFFTLALQFYKQGIILYVVFWALLLCPTLCFYDSSMLLHAVTFLSFSLLMWYSNMWLYHNFISLFLLDTGWPSVFWYYKECFYKHCCTVTWYSCAGDALGYKPKSGILG